MRVIFWLIAVVLCVTFGVSGGHADDAAKVRDIFYEGIIVLDPEARWTPKEALVEAAKIENQPRQRVPAGGNVYWLVEEVRNPGDVSSWWVEVFAARSDYIDLYVFENGVLEQHVEGGLLRQATEQKMLKGMGSHVLPFSLQAGEKRTLILRVQSRSLINYSIKAGPDYALNNTRVYRHFLVYSLMGGMLFLILYNLFLGVALREVDYFLYAAHGSSYFFFFLNSYGFAATLLGWTAHPWITVFAGFGIEIFGIAFVLRFLRVREWSRALHWLMTGCVALLVALVIATPFVGYLTMAEIWMISYALVPFLVLIAASIGIARKVRQSPFILIGWTPMVAMTLTAILAMLGYLDRPPSGAAVNASVLLEMLVLSLALADRVRQLRGERERAIREGQEKSTFLAMLSHEVRTPLNGIMGTIELLGRTRLSADQRGYVENLRNAGNALMSLLNDVLHLAKSEAGKSEIKRSHVDLVGVTRSMCDLMSARASEKGLALSLRTEGTIPKNVEADEVRLRQVLLNLIGNAVKFTDNGEVVVSLNGTTAENGNACVDFEIRDTGIGIDHRDMDDLFRPFVQLQSGTAQSTEGTGLGLSISRDLVRAMGGDIRVESRPGHGSSFRFALEFVPLPEETAQPETDTPSIPMAATGTRVLVVDDVELNRKVLTELLAHFGYTVSAAASGEEALRRAKSETFDAIVTDVFMPGMDGPELARRLRKRKCPARVLGLTAAYDDAVRMDCLAAGIDLVLAKPVSGEALHRNLSGILGMSQPVHSTAEQAEPEFEPKYLDGYFETLGYGPTLQMISKFRSGIDGEMEDLLSASTAGRTDLCAHALHKLGGALATVGLLKIGRSLEVSAVRLRSGDKEKISLDKIHADLETSLGQLEFYLEGKAADQDVEVA